MIEVIIFNRYLQRKSPYSVEPKSFALTLQATDWETFLVLIFVHKPFILIVLLLDVWPSK